MALPIGRQAWLRETLRGARRSCSVFFALFAQLYAVAQLHDANWVFCKPNIILRFDSTGFVVDSFTLTNRTIDFFNSNASFSNVEGELLFLSNGYRVYDRNGNNMQDGNTLVLSNVEKGQAGTDTSSGSGTIANPVVIPIGNSDDRFLMVRKSVTGVAHDIYTYTIDMKENNELGRVVISNNLIAKDMSGSSIGACKHANGQWWWLIARRVNSNQYIKWLVKENGLIETIDTQATGPVLTGFDYFTQNVFSIRGDKFVTGNSHDYIVTFDFDRCTGQLNFRDSLPKPPLDTLFFSGNSGLQLSPNGRFLYASRYLYLHQYDLEAQDVKSSAVLLADLDSTTWFSFTGKPISYMQLAPDGKIYIDGYGSPIELSVINHPDSGGIACGLDTFKIGFPDSQNWSGMPTYPHYRTPPVEVWQAGAGNSREVCDSIITANGVTLGKPHVNGVKYTWSSPSNTNFSSTAPQPTVQPTGTTTYIVHLQDTVSTYYSCTERWDTVTITVVQSCISSVGSSPATDGGFKVYPNPASDQVSITAEVKGKWQLIDALERVVVEQEIEHGTTTIATEQLAAGVYYYVFTTSQKVQQYGKLVKQ